MHVPRSGLLLVLALWVLLLHPVAMTSAFVLDQDASGQNTVSGGMLDAKLSEIGPATEGSTLDEQTQDSIEETWKDTSHRDSDDVNNTVRINNTRSSLDASRVNVTVSYVESDGALGSSGNGDETARTYVIRSVEYRNTELVGSEIVDENGNGVVDLEDMTLGETATNLTHLSGVAAGATADLHLSIDGNPGLLVSPGSEDGLNITVTIRSESSGYADRDVSQNNVIRYATL